jgi:predicted nucleotidyltransferase
LKELVEELSSSINEEEFEKNFLEKICIYVCGSLGRDELSEESDLDLFFIYDSVDTCNNLEKYRFFSKVYDVNKKLGFKDPSGNGLYWDFIFRKKLIEIGSRDEDYVNSFTARLLLMLESKPIFNTVLYNNIIKEVISAYFKDYDDHSGNFFPMYLINDILRYWFTLTLNFEYRRNDKDDKHKRYWKRLKLKFPRLLTCFSMLACLFRSDINKEYVSELTSKTPLEILDIAAGTNNNILLIVKKIKEQYNWFLSLTKETPSWWSNEENKKLAFDNADNFHEIIIRKLLNEISKNNPDLKKKIEI